MDPFKVYSIPLKSLRNGLHKYQWELGNSFFKYFEHSPIKKGHFNLEMSLDKQDDLSVIQLDINGDYQTICDRCLANIRMPVQRHHQIYVKTVNEQLQDPDLICIAHDALELKLAEVFYEYICLSLPLSQTMFCEGLENPPCDFEVLKRLKSADDHETDNSIWDELKKFDKN